MALIRTGRVIRVIMAVLGLCVAGYLGLMLVTTPSNDRPWALEQHRLPSALIDGQQVHVRNIRNFHYRSSTDYDPAWYDRSFDLSRLKRVYFIIEPLSSWDAVAHTFLSFEFEGGEGSAGSRFLSISVEIRREVDESFSPLMGLLRQYELMYVIADERDIIKLRANYRDHDVYIYPANMPSLQAMQELLLGMLERANQINRKPEFYNTLTNNCMTNIVRHINALFPYYVPWSRKVLFPGYSDELAYELDMIDTDLSFEEARSYYQINALALQHADADEFSTVIRRVRK